MSRRDDDRRKRLEKKAMFALVGGHLKEAERAYRALGGHAIALQAVALHAREWERAASMGLRWLRWWDTAKKEVPPERWEKAWQDYAIAVRGIAIALENLEEEAPPHGEAPRKRRARIVADGRRRLAEVEDWPKVNRIVREFVRTGPQYFGPYATTRLGRNLAREGLGAAVGLLLEGHVHLAWYTVKGIRRAGAARSPFASLDQCPHCIDEAASESLEDARVFVPLLRDVLAAARREAAAPKDRENALLEGMEALYFARILGRSGDAVDDLLARAEACLRLAPTLAPSSEAGGGTDAQLAAFVAYARAQVAELRGDVGAAIPLLEGLAAGDAEPWAAQAADLLAHLRTIRDAEARRRRAADLRARWAAAKDAGDAATERALLADLVAVADEDPLVERLARLELDAGAPAWRDRASEAVRRGSRDPALVAALARDATASAAEDPRDAIPRFRLALRGGPLDPVAAAAFAAALRATGRHAEAGRAFEALAAADQERYADAASAYAAGGEVRRALAAVASLLDSDAPLPRAEEAYASVAPVAAPDELRPIAEKMIARDPAHREAADLLARLRERDVRARAQAAALARSEGLASFGGRAWAKARERLAAVPEAFRDDETRRALARSCEALGRPQEALALYEVLPPSREVLEGRARCLARLHRPAEAREPIRALVDLLEADEIPAIGDDPDLVGLLAEARGDLRGAAVRLEDEGLLHALAERARSGGDPLAEYEALARLVEAHPARRADHRERLAALDALVPVRAKGRHAADAPALVLCDTNVLLAHLLEDASVPEALHDLRRPAGAERLRGLRTSNARLAVTRTVARETVAVLRYQCAVQEDEAVAEAVRRQIARAEELAASLDVARVAGLAPRTGGEDLERVRAFYRPFRARLRGITDRKARRDPGRSAAIRSKRTRGRPGVTPLPEAADLRLLAEAAWLAGAPVAGVGRVGLLSDDADFRDFREEIERVFGVRVY